MKIYLAVVNDSGQLWNLDKKLMANKTYQIPISNPFS